MISCIIAMFHNAAHELKAWLLHYSPVILSDYLPQDFYQHHLLLVEGTYLLLKDVVTKDDILQSSKLFNHYCFLFPALYGMQLYTYLMSNSYMLIRT